MTKPPAMACAVCRCPLNIHSPYGSTRRTWVHPAGITADHDPVPVPTNTLDGVTYRCDFCGDTTVAFLYSTTADTTAVVASPRFYDRTRNEQIGRHTWVERSIDAPAADISTLHSLGGWTACGPCAELIELRDCERLITRFRRRHPDLTPARKHLRATFTAFFAVIGPRAPIGERQAPG